MQQLPFGVVVVTLFASLAISDGLDAHAFVLDGLDGAVGPGSRERPPEEIGDGSGGLGVGIGKALHRAAGIPLVAMLRITGELRRRHDAARVVAVRRLRSRGISSSDDVAQFVVRALPREITEGAGGVLSGIVVSQRLLVGIGALLRRVDERRKAAGVRFDFGLREDVADEVLRSLEVSRRF